MITQTELIQARATLLDRAVAFFVEQRDVTGIFLAGSLPAGSADAYSDIDLRVIATSEGQVRLVEGRLEWPAHWGDLLFNEWLDGTQHCVSHFRPFLKIDVFYWTPAIFTPSPWFGMPAKVFLDRDGLVQSVLAQSQAMTFSHPSATEVSRIVSKALAGAHEVVRRARRGELHFAHSLLDELRCHLARLDGWIQGFTPSAPHDLKLAARIGPDLTQALARSYVGLNATALDEAVVSLGHVLAQQIQELHRRTELHRSLATDMAAVELVTGRAVA
jgi:predicted nucleotidyltransferase